VFISASRTRGVYPARVGGDIEGCWGGVGETRNLPTSQWPCHWGDQTQKCGNISACVSLPVGVVRRRRER